MEADFLREKLRIFQDESRVLKEHIKRLEHKNRELESRAIEMDRILKQRRDPITLRTLSEEIEKLRAVDKRFSESDIL
jgi:hypothetical protein